MKKFFSCLVAAISLCWVASASAYTLYGLPYKWGDYPWQYNKSGGTVSWSIVTDGQNWANMPVDWISQVADAFNTWEAASGGQIKFRQVTDDGRAPGPGDNLVNGQNGDNAGDIRFWAASGTSWIGVSYGPKNYWGSDWMGDITFNTDYFPWASVYWVALHEIGHSLGLGHSADGGAVMYPYYWGQPGGLNADDIAGIQKLYGLVPEPSSAFLFFIGGTLIWIYGRRRQVHS